MITVPNPTPEAKELFLRGVQALCDVERNGIRVNIDGIKESEAKVTEIIKEKEENLREHDIFQMWQKIYGKKFNIESPAQLGNILYNHMGFECPEQTENGQNKTDESVLMQLNEPFVEDYIRVKKYKKLFSTYIKNIIHKTQNNGKYHLLHPFFHLNLVQTYRSSSSDPNFQNFPKRDEEIARYIRECFIPRDNHYLLEIDYGQLEVRFAAIYHEDDVMLRYLFDPSTDMHKDTACDLYKLPPEEVTKGVRHASKNKFVFPEFYGSFYKIVSKDLWDAIDMNHLATNSGVPLKTHLETQGIYDLEGFTDHVKVAEDIFWNKRFRKYTRWKEEWVDQYYRQGWMQTKPGFVMQGLMRRNQIINYPVQSTAFHCLLKSLIRINRLLKKKRMRSMIVGQIHDSLVCDVHKNETR